MKGKLYIIPTPIGNLEDITLRAIRILEESDYILAENIRHSKKLLNRYQINKKLVSYHMHNERTKTSSIIDDIQLKAQRISLVSDSGTPCISDPGYLLIKQAISQKIEVECLPGATAFVPSLVMSGLPLNQFIFWGFLPSKKGRKKVIQEVANETRTSILYESPRRIKSLLDDLLDALGNKRIVSIAKEISKINETVCRGTIENVIRQMGDIPIKGEFTVTIAAA